MLIASIFLCFARYASVTSGDPSLIIRWTVIKLLKTTVHVESLSRCCRARKTSPTPASPACVATRMCSMYFVFGGAACSRRRCQLFLFASSPPNVPAMIACYHVAIASGRGCLGYMWPRTLILVAPLTDFSNELAMLVGRFSSMRIVVLQLSRGFRRAGADGW